MRWVGFSLLLGAFAGCDARGPGTAVEFSAERGDWVAGFCGLDDDGIRGASSAAPSHAAPDTILRLEDGRIASVATSSGGMTAIYNDMSARVVGLDDTGMLVEFGRTGSGPGEFFSSPPVMIAVEHVSVSEASFLVFDRVRFLEFDLAGHPLHSVRVPGLHPMSTVVLRSTSEAHVVGIIEQNLRSPDRRLELHRWVEGSLEPVGGIALTPLARVRGGSWGGGSFLPMPLWDVAGGCGILSDGSSAELVVLHLQSGEMRSLQLHGHPYSDRELLGIQEARHEAFLASAREWNLPVSEVEFSEPTRWSGLRYDRDGSLWLWPSLKPDDVPMALRIPLQSSAPDPHLVRDASLPAAFLPNGVPLSLASSHGEGWSDVVVRLGPAR